MSSESMGDIPSTTIELRDGRVLRVDAQGVHVSDTLYPLDLIEDARQVAPEPETIGLRVKGTGLVSLVVAKRGHAAAVLDALFRLRPDLRHAGFVPPVDAPSSPPPPDTPTSNTPTPNAPAPHTPLGGFPPPAGPWPYPPPAYGAPSSYSAPGYTPPGFPPPGYPPYPPYPPPYPGYSIVPPPVGMAGGSGRPPRGLGPWPQGIGEVLGTTFRLYFSNIGRFILLGIAVCLWPALLTGGFETLVYYAEGFDPFKGILDQSAFTALTTSSNPASSVPFNSPIMQWLQNPPSAGQIAAAAGIGVLALIMAIVLGAWQLGALAIAARDVVAGRPVRVGAAMRGGLRRLLPVLGAQILVFLVMLGVALAGAAIIFGLIFVGVAALVAGTRSNSGVGTGIGAVLLILLGGFAGEILIAVAATYVRVRLGLAPYAAAADRIGAGSALGRSWSLTWRNWWRTFLPLLVIAIVVAIATGASGGVAVYSLILEYLIVFPLLTAIVTPLAALAYVVVYYDLRLRHEGYPRLAAELDLLGGPARPPAGSPPPGASSMPTTPGGATGAQPPAGPADTNGTDGPAQPDHPPAG